MLCFRSFSSAFPRSWNILSSYFAPTLRDAPADAVVVSHKLLTRAGYVRPSSSGIFSFLPLGNRLLRRISDVVEDEMERIGCRQVSLPLLLSEELWRKTGRWQEYGDELMRLKDRKGVSYCLAPTHEEAISDLVAAEISSHRNLPLRLFQIGRKYRDELRPRFGLMRGREFVMKDLYTFDKTKQEAFQTYEDVSGAYERIFNRMGLQWVRCVADSGAIGGNLSHEYQVRCPAGEDTLVFCKKCGYQANIEKAVAGPKIVSCEPADLVSILQVSGSVGSSSSSEVSMIQCKIVVPHQVTVNCVQMSHALGFKDVRNTSFTVDNIEQVAATDLKNEAFKDGLVVVDTSLSRLLPSALVADLQFPRGSGVCNEPDCERTLTTTAGMEVGHVFYLGTKYSSSMNVKYQDADGKGQMAEMGCFGIGVSRLMSAIAEVHHDENGLKWPLTIAPYCLHIVSMSNNSSVLQCMKDACFRLFSDKSLAHFKLASNTLIDDRMHLSAGVRMKDALLMGTPYIIVFGNKSLEKNEAEIHSRNSGQVSAVRLEHLNTVVQKLLEPLEN
ncbi:mitochondrial prolyl-tRNA synthetase (ProRS) [Andalucia godoyi]|uniref:proline--tRNA ligase n=1 Tax=Andalucia godoyi TaxID=505711 RepID=A0A8K0F349_ANDGO|nr:mitochondrial prolyl-tRNA synthetase (ProRS) [Andalucia godoyi]|eukprot:ANDGO_02336.mRNA.1 mitochondrial prolyl-tRNA synthetase (ProRS)